MEFYDVDDDAERDAERKIVKYVYLKLKVFQICIILCIVHINNSKTPLFVRVFVFFYRCVKRSRARRQCRRCPYGYESLDLSDDSDDDITLKVCRRPHSTP